MTSIATRFNAKLLSPLPLPFFADGTEANSEIIFEGVRARTLPDLPGYAFGENGWVISFKRTQPHVLRQGTSAAGCYCYANIGSGKLKKSQYVHRHIARAFHPNPLQKPQVNHKDGNPQNNAASNLEWVTPAENIQHAVRLQRSEGRKRFNATPEQQNEMLALALHGFSMIQVARIFEMPHDLVRRSVKVARKRLH